MCLFSVTVPSSGVAGLYDSLIPGFLGNLHTVLHSGCISCLCHFTHAHSPSTGNTSPVPSQPTFPHPALRARPSGSPLWAGVPATLLCTLNIIIQLLPFSLALEPVFSDPTCCRLFETDSFFFFQIIYSPNKYLWIGLSYNPLHKSWPCPFSLKGNKIENRKSQKIG